MEYLNLCIVTLFDKTDNTCVFICMAIRAGHFDWASRPADTAAYFFKILFIDVFVFFNVYILLSIMPFMIPAQR